MLHVSCFVFHVSYLYAVLNKLPEMMCNLYALGACADELNESSAMLLQEIIQHTTNWNSHLLEETFHLYATELEIHTYCKRPFICTQPQGNFGTDLSQLYTPPFHWVSVLKVL
jgi:hypothetical protein